MMGIKNSVAAKLIMAIFGMMAFFLILLCYEYQNRINELDARYETDLTALIEFLRRPAEDFLFTGYDKPLDAIAKKVVGKKVISAILINDSKGASVYQVPQKLPHESKVREVRLLQSFDAKELAIEPEIDTNNIKPTVLGTMTVYLDNTERDTVKHDLFNQLLLSVVITLVFALIVAGLSIIFISVPLRKIQSAMQSIQGGNYDSNLKIAQNDEIGRLASMVNAVARDLDRKRQQHKDQMKEITGSHTELTNSQIEKNTVLDRLLEGVIPALQEAMETVSLLRDKQSLQANLSRSILFALSLTQETKSLVSSYTDQIIFSPEKMRFTTMVDRIRDILAHLGELRGIEVDIRIDTKGDLSNHFVIADNVQTARLLTHIYEMVDLKTSSTVKIKSIWIILEINDTDKIRADLILRVGNSDLSSEFVQAVNTYLSSEAGAVNNARFRNDYELLTADTKSSNFAVQLYTVFGLKNLVDSLRGTYTVINSGVSETLHTFSCPIPASDIEESITQKLEHFSRKQNQKVCIIGSAQFIRKQRSRLFSQDDNISFIYYDKVDALELNTLTHYIIDLMSDSAAGQSIAEMIINLKSTTHNVCGVLSAADHRNNTMDLEMGFDHGFDFIVCDAISIADVQKIRSRKKLVERNDALKDILNKIKLAESN